MGSSNAVKFQCPNYKIRNILIAGLPLYEIFCYSFVTIWECTSSLIFVDLLLRKFLT
ncbi:hypothetical protein KsCSTR_24120 [Candidatus Kuenenia stuttgartiensis]|uniref:Uncharacterized protein n=1 Tax=Kuenenia stuttgartiensis TaxID=174633 RepID=Q1Q3V1_KUEST|nr:hypothetical protein KsCSTR_24120 [Candidatus Kuenenia stuttgartiensis]CAJ74688.1 unknown protein [Candidatus Kuenenia stuttgartiensis]